MKCLAILLLLAYSCKRSHGKCKRHKVIIVMPQKLLYTSRIVTCQPSFQIVYQYVSVYCTLPCTQTVYEGYIAVIALTVIIGTASNRLRAARYRVVLPGKASSDVAMLTTVKQNFAGCGLLCYSSSCKSFVYNQVTKECRLFEQTPSMLNIIDDSSSDIWTLYNSCPTGYTACKCDITINGIVR